MISATRYHDISCGHRVVGHEGACARLHGHNYRIYFTITARHGFKGLDEIGRVIDFSEIKNKLCKWLDDNWDHKFLVWNEDPLAISLTQIDPTVCIVEFNPTAENIAMYLVKAVGPVVLRTDVILSSCTVEETRKCSATYNLTHIPD